MALVRGKAAVGLVVLIGLLVIGCGNLRAGLDKPSARVRVRLDPD